MYYLGKDLQSFRETALNRMEIRRRNTGSLPIRAIILHVPAKNVDLIDINE